MDLYLASASLLISDQYGTSGTENIGIFDSEEKAKAACESYKLSSRNKSLLGFDVKKHKLNGDEE